MTPQDTTPQGAGFRNKRTAPFTMLANTMLRDPSLSLRAKGLLGVMLSFPDDWQYHMSHIETLSADQRDAHRAAVRELERAGYIRREQTRDERGRVSKSVYTVSDALLTVDGLTGDGETGDGRTGAGETPTTNTDYTKTDRTKKKDGAEPRRAGQAGILSVSDNPEQAPLTGPAQTAGKGSRRDHATDPRNVPGGGAAVELPPVLMARPGWEEVWGAWLAYRRERRLTCTPATLNAQLRKLAAEPDPAAVIEQSITNGWAGLFPLKSAGPARPQSQQQANDKFMRGVEEKRAAVAGVFDD